MGKFIGIAGVLALTVFSNADAAPTGPYAGQEQRAIKALSSEEIDSYLSGKGAGLAKAAELNHYPGPLHVLELAETLQLNPQQKARSEAVFKAMQTQAVLVGKALVDKEQELDRKFASGAMTSKSLHLLLAQIGKLQAEVRGAHLQAHLDQRAILTQEQIAKYDDLRGYTTGNATGHGGHSHH